MTEPTFIHRGRPAGFFETWQVYEKGCRLSTDEDPGRKGTHYQYT